MLFILLAVVISLQSRFYAGRDFLSDVEILRDKSSKDAVFRFDRSLNFLLYSGNTVETIDYANPILEGTGPGNFDLIVPKTRIYFHLFTNQGKALLSDHHLPLGFNFRDMGGIRTKNGQHIKYGKAIRADELFNLTGEDIDYLESIPIKTVVDFRSASEKEAAPDANVSDIIYLDYPIDAGNLEALARDAITSGIYNPSVLRAAMVDLYKGLVTNPEFVETYKKFFEALQNPESTPIIWHCSAGKDRAGTATILFLSSLGISRDRILADYLESNEYLRPKYGGYMTQYPFLTPLFEAAEPYLEALFDAIKENYKSVEAFLTDRLNVNLSDMKRLFLE